MKPKLSQRTLDLMRHANDAVGSWDEEIIAELVSSAYVDGAAEMLSRLRGAIASGQRVPDEKE